MTAPAPHALARLLGMVRSPRATLRDALIHQKWLDLAVSIVVLAAASNALFLSTRVGQLAALDQQVRQLESFGVEVTDARYDRLKALVPYRPAIGAAAIALGWPVAWLLLAAGIRAIGNRMSGRRAGFVQVLTIVVHASALLAVRAVVEAPINYARESLGGATALSAVLPSFAEATFPARLAGAIDIFVVWTAVLLAMGLAELYHARTTPIARWIFGAYGAVAVALALTQALRGGM